MDKLPNHQSQVIEDKSLEMEQATKDFFTKFSTCKFEGYSKNKEVCVTINGDNEVLDIKFTSKTLDPKLLTDALNNAFEQAEFDFLTKLDVIEYGMFGDTIDSIEKPGKLTGGFKEALKNFKKH